MAKSKKIDKDMGFRLKKARLDQKLTYDELSEKSGVSSRYIKEIENHGNVPSLEKLGQLIRALHISADPFFYPAAPTDNLDYQRLLVYLSECTNDQITTILANRVVSFPVSHPPCLNYSLICISTSFTLFLSFKIPSPSNICITSTIP